MKYRKGFVTNSSSSSFIITATTPEAEFVVNLLKEIKYSDFFIGQAANNGDVDDMIYWYSADGNHEKAKHLQNLKENERAYFISTDNHDQSILELIQVCDRRVNGFNIEVDYS